MAYVRGHLSYISTHRLRDGYSSPPQAATDNEFVRLRRRDIAGGVTSSRAIIHEQQQQQPQRRLVVAN